MDERHWAELRALQELARAAVSEVSDPESLLERVCSQVRETFRLRRASVIRPNAAAAQHPLVERARGEGRAVTDGQRVAVPLLADDTFLGFVIGDCEGEELAFDEGDLQLLTALVAVGAAFVSHVGEKSRLARSLDARTNFVSLASHELRTPISVTHGIVSTLHLRGRELSREQIEMLCATAYEQTAKLAALTDQLLDLSRLEAGVAARKRQRVQPRRLVEEVLLRTVPDRLDDVAVEIDPELELESDPDALERVLVNLVVNAFRYGAPPVRVQVDTHRLVVEDCGAGIDPALAPRLFDRFTRGHATEGGSGLGLAIARSYAEALGGRLLYEQAEPHGARFALVLPQARVPA
jgi:signal transduction histidine kinase